MVNSISSSSASNYSSSTNNTSQTKPDESKIIQSLVAQGIPESVATQGRDAVHKYAEEHNITLKKPENAGSTSGTSGTTASSELQTTTGSGSIFDE